MKKVLSTTSEAFTAFATHPVWKLETGESHGPFRALLEESRFVSGLVPTASGEEGVLLRADTLSGMEPLGLIRIFGDAAVPFIEMSCEAAFPFVGGFPQPQTLGSLLEASLGCPVVFESRGLDISGAQTCFYSIFHSGRGGIIASLKSWRDDEGCIRLMTSLMLLPGIEQRAGMESLLLGRKSTELAEVA